MLPEVRLLSSNVNLQTKSYWTDLIARVGLSECWVAAVAELAEINSDWFKAEYWQSTDAIEGTSCGRHTTWFIHYQASDQNHHWVLRHYWRGGLIANLLKDSYGFIGLEKTRPIMELRLLHRLWDEGFPVPKPIAALVKKKGFCYQGDLIIERIDGAKDLVDLLSQAELVDEQWHDLGVCIAEFHRRGVYHADLNAKNILYSTAGFHLIDFDRGEIRKPQSKWQVANLKRLRRSFAKEKNKNSALAYSDAHWQCLLDGYGSVNNLDTADL